MAVRPTSGFSYLWRLNVASITHNIYLRPRGDRESAIHDKAPKAKRIHEASYKIRRLRAGSSRRTYFHAVSSYLSMHDASSKQTLHFMRFASQAKHATTDTILFIKHDMHIAHKYSTDSAYAMIQTSSVSFWHFNRIIHEHIQTDYGSVDLISYLGRWLGLTHS